MSDAPDYIRYHLTGELDERRAKKVVRHLTELDAEDPHADWEITISSHGGDMFASNAIFTELSSYATLGGGTHRVITKVRGRAASGASLIFQAGDLRVGSAMDSLMLHEPILSFGSVPLNAVRDYVAECEEWLDRYADIYLRRSTLSREEFFDNITGRNWVVWMDRAVEFGFADVLG